MTTSSKPNILVIWGDDIGITNLSCNTDGVMGYRTPNIDRVALWCQRSTLWAGSLLRSKSFRHDRRLRVLQLTRC